MKGLNYILIIGIDPYNHPTYPSLENASDDALRIQKILVEVYNFEQVSAPILNEDATRDNIIEAFINLRSICTNEDRLIIYYAGHGLVDPQSGRGMWVPIDAVHKTARLIYDTDIANQLEAIEAKHVLLISDSCFSGKLFQQTRSLFSSSDYEQLENRKSRWIFYSGEQAVSDGLKGVGSPFCQAICQFLDSQKDRIFSTGEIVEFVRLKLKDEGKPMPGSRHLNSKHDNGQIVFRSNQLAEQIRSIVTYDKQQFSLPASKTSHPYLTRTFSEFDLEAIENISFFQKSKSSYLLSDLIQIQKRIVILGTAGSGKSVELLEMAKLLQKNDYPNVPIFKRFNIYTGEAIEDFLDENWQNIDPVKLVLFFDGLDEIQPIHFHTALRKITSFAEKNPFISIVISCRSNFYDLPKKNFSGTLDGFSIYNINDISVSEVTEYVEKNFKINATEFIEATRIAKIQSWILKPFFLGIVIDYFLIHSKLIGKRVEIMEYALENSYWSNKAHFITTSQVALKEIAFSMLKKIAFVMELLGKNFLTDSELFNIFTERSDQENCKFLPAFHRDNEKEHWMFEHNNIQEFLASDILSKKPLEKVIELITIPLGSTSKIKPTWTNTLSFLISIGEDNLVNPLLDWVLNFDPEALIRFEAGRISTKLRIEIFKKIFDDYNSKEIWIRSNKFTDEELCTFGYFSNVLEYLVSIIENNKQSRIARLNTVHLLQHYVINDFSNFKDRIKNALLQQLIHFDEEQNDYYGIQTILGTMANLGLTDEHTTDLVVDRFNKRLNQHVRAGMYKYLIQSTFLDKYVDVFLEGVTISIIEDAVEDRESINLMDEFIYLKIGLEKIKNPNALIKIIHHFISEEKQTQIYLFDFKEVFISINEALIAAYQEDNKIFNEVLSFYHELVNRFNKELSNIISVFFERTVTKWEALKVSWILCKEMNTYQTSEYCVCFLDETTFSQLLDYIRKENSTKSDILKLYEILSWNKLSIQGVDNLLLQVEILATKYNIELPEKKVQYNWEDQQKTQIQMGFDTLFNLTLFESEILRVFNGMNTDSLSSDDLFGLRKGILINLDVTYNVAALDALREQVFNRELVTREYMETWLSSQTNVISFVIRKAYEYLHSNKKLLINISEDQRLLIQQYCNQIQLSDNIVWFFLNEYTISFSDDRLLSLTNYFDHNSNFDLSKPGTIDEIEKYLPKDQIFTKVLCNIKYTRKFTIMWISNAAYAIRNNLTEAFSDIWNFLEIADDQEYKLEDLLTIWYKSTGDTSRLKSLIENAKSEELRLKGIKILTEEKLEITFLLTNLIKLMNDTAISLNYRIEAANRLLEFGQIEGFYFLSKLILEDPLPTFDFNRSLRNFKLLKDIKVVEILIQLLAIAKQSQFQDHFNSLEEKVMEAFYSIGTFSEENFLIIKSAFEKFIIDNKDKFENLNFLYIRISDIEYKLTYDKSMTLTIHDAIIEFKNL